MDLNREQLEVYGNVMRSYGRALEVSKFGLVSALGINLELFDREVPEKMRDQFPMISVARQYFESEAGKPQEHKI